MFASLTSRLKGQSLASSSSSSSATPDTVATPGNGDDAEEAEGQTYVERELRPLEPQVEQRLKDLGVDLVACGECPSPCDPIDPTTHPSSIHSTRLLSAWNKQEVDFDSTMLPSNSPFLRHVCISTGKKDWIRDIAEVEGSLANLWEAEIQKETSSQGGGGGGGGGKGGKEGKKGGKGGKPGPELAPTGPPNGCYQTIGPYSSNKPSKLLLSNTSQISSSSSAHSQSVCLLPDYVMITDVPDATSDDEQERHQGKQAAEQVYKKWITANADSSISVASTSSQHSPRRHVLPHRAVILLCSHTKRDARCGLAAPMLSEVIKRYAERDGWEVDERGDDCVSTSDRSASDVDEVGNLQWDEDWGVVTNRGWGYIYEPTNPSSTDDNTVPSPDEQILSWRHQLHLSSLPSSPTSPSALPLPKLKLALPPPNPSVLILYTSHIGKHAWSGNLTVYLPNGAATWYGRVDPLTGAGRVWEQTILQGRVIGEYLRLGINLIREGGEAGEAGGERGQGDGEQGQDQGANEAQAQAQGRVEVAGSKSQIFLQRLEPRGQGILRW